MKHPLGNLSAFFYVTLAGLLLITSCKKDYSAEDVVIPPEVKDHNLVLNFRAVVDTNLLEFGDTYRNNFKENYSVNTFKFYIHGIELINTDSNKTVQVAAGQYFLVDFKDPSTTRLELTVFPYKYNRITFTIGVDSIRNVSGAQTGALDPAKGMFWTWSTGYIMAKLEGNFGATAFEYHIGGFSGTNNVLKKPILLFPFAQNLDMKPEKTSELVISANANSWFYNPHEIRLSVNPVCTTPGILAKQISENYSKMFTVDSVSND
ncbi:MAG: hypothetical protein H7Y31_02170 [Chitinophagaceae bacterium]|nr:hypothetical protein [Chitinophagaceae bacterium]